MSKLNRLLQRARAAVAPLALLLLVIAYATTLQTHISGSFIEGRSEALRLQNEYIKDVGEIQVALNVWGTIHHTGYPLYAILGNLFTLPFRTLGVEPAAAASLYALAWGTIALAAFGALLWRLTGRRNVAVLGLVVAGLARSIWIHNVIAEVYSMALAVTVLMWAVVLWPGRWNVARRIGTLALLVGIGVAHHRAVLFVVPGVLVAAWPPFAAERHRRFRLIVEAAGLWLIGFVPYVYLPLREWQGGEWVYGEPGSWRGFWIEFTGQEADRLVTLPAGLGGWIANARDVIAILAVELTLPGLVIGIMGLVLALLVSPHRRAAQIVLLSAAGPALFAVAYHTAVLPQAILMPVVLALVFGAALAADWLMRVRPQTTAAILIGLAAWGLALLVVHRPYMQVLVSEPTGLETIERLTRLKALRPDDERIAVIYPWGPRYFAASYARLVTGEHADLRIVEHKADYRRLLSDGYTLFTERETFYTFRPNWPTPYGPPMTWWNERLGDLHLTSPVPGMVQVLNAPPIEGPRSPAFSENTPLVYGIVRRGAWLTCDDESIYLHVIWQANTVPTADPSIFVHLTGDQPAPKPVNADSRYPVYGLYPFTRWEPGEVVYDTFTLPRLPDKTLVRFGLYEQTAPNTFVNYGESILPVSGCQEIDLGP